MTRRQKHWWNKMSENVTFRLYLSAVWRYVIWLVLFNFMWFILTFCILLLMGSPFQALKETYFMARLDDFMQHIGLHLIAFYMTLDSLMQFGFKSGRYRVVVESTGHKKKR